MRPSTYNWARLVIEEFVIADLLPRLVDRSLVSYDVETGRYSLLETVRQYGAEHQVNSGESMELRERHLDYFLDLAADGRQKVRGPDQVRWLQRYDAEHDNFRLALDWALDVEDDIDKAVLLAYRLADYWMIRSNFQESDAVLERMAARDDLSEANHCRIFIVRSSIGYFRAKPAADMALEAIALARKTKDLVLIGDALATAILDLLTSNRVEEAQKLRAEAMQALDTVGDHVMTAFVHINFGNSAFLRGDMDEAEHHFEECYRTRRRAKDLRGVGAALISLGYVKERRGLDEEAIHLFRRGISAYALVASPWDIGGGICCMGLELNRAGRMEDLAKVLGFGDALLRRVGGQRDRVDSIGYAQWMERAAIALGALDFEKFRKVGSRMTLNEVLDLLFPNGLEVPPLEDPGSDQSQD